MASGDRAATSPKKPSGKKKKPLSQKEQSERFIQTARELEADENSEAFAHAIERVLPTKKN